MQVEGQAGPRAGFEVNHKLLNEKVLRLGWRVRVPPDGQALCRPNMHNRRSTYPLECLAVQ